MHARFSCGSSSCCFQGNWCGHTISDILHTTKINLPVQLKYLSMAWLTHIKSICPARQTIITKQNRHTCQVKTYPFPQHSNTYSYLAIIETTQTPTLFRGLQNPLHTHELYDCLSLTFSTACGGKGLPLTESNNSSLGSLSYELYVSISMGPKCHPPASAGIINKFQQEPSGSLWCLAHCSTSPMNCLLTSVHF